MTSAEPTPAAGADAAFCDALAGEYGAVYAYGMVSAYSPPDANDLVAVTIRQHRDRRDRTIAILTGRSVTIPVAAAGYRLPIPVANSTEAAQLAVRLENNAAVAWRAVVEQTREPADREFAATALGQCAVLAAQWNRTLGAWPITGAFPGGED